MLGTHLNHSTFLKHIDPNPEPNNRVTKSLQTEPNRTEPTEPNHALVPFAARPEERGLPVGGAAVQRGGGSGLQHVY